MDEIVAAALRKWPNVPAVRGWLGLDVRGDWWLRDEHVQAAGPFPQAKGSRVEHVRLREFIARNYASEDGAWFFQNGPQRVYVELQAAPWIWRVQPDDSLVAHTGQTARAERALVDDGGRLFVATDLGLGLVHSQDVYAASDAVARGAWPLEEARFADLPARFGYVLSPATSPR